MCCKTEQKAAQFSVYIDSDARTDFGRLFQAETAAAGKARSREVGTCVHSVESDQR